ncbi:hypothetical protein COCVIDRAFT_24632 [Bipolaris victoriae FI3]|uniref:F-box domain-containing protein n=1 Tax=Bipolaris victoriae (strain FI3) TaxID=930091 RepID=W7ETF8_BIPV3|nr:hypothetical protein COCVIDRAFT_24632 [Bipolaris victoriae FI3]
MTRYLRIQQDIEVRKKRIFGDSWEEIDEERLTTALLTPFYDEFGELEAQAEEDQQRMDNDPTLQRLKAQLIIADEKLNSVATACSELELCLPLTSLILSRLPRELRDQIYDLLWGDEHAERLDEALSITPDALKISEQPILDLPHLSVPPFANSRFVGIEFASEAATRYFRAITVAEIDYRCVRAHINRNRFGPMCFPIKEIISRLTISVYENSLYGLGMSGFAKTALEDSLDSLLMLKSNRHLKVKIYLPWRIQYKKSLFQVLETIRPFSATFRNANMDVRVLGYDFFNPIEDDSEWIFSEQLNYYFDGTPEEWLEMKIKEVKEIADARQRKACKGILRAMRVNLEFFNKESRHNEATEAT